MLIFKDDLLVKQLSDNNYPVVVSFPFLVEIVAKVHGKLNHVGRHKAMDYIRNHFWHPALEKVLRDFCASCKYCQIYKTNIQQIKPPMLKIQSGLPFDTIAVDLMKLPETRSKNICQ